MTASIRQARPRQTVTNETRRVGGYRAKGVPEGMLDLDFRAATPDTPARKCCGKCKTPYNCGNKSCRCHSV